MRNLSGIMSTESIISLFPNVEDAKKEIEKKKAEEEVEEYDEFFDKKQTEEELNEE